MPISVFGIPIHNIFGVSIRPSHEVEPTISFVPPKIDDGSLVVDVADSGAQIRGSYINFDEVTRNEIELITKYRAMMSNPDVSMAVTDIVDEMIVRDGDTECVSINLDKLKISDSIKESISKEFNKICRMLNLKKNAADLARQFYTDGRLYHHLVVDKGNLDDGIREMRYIDPRQIRKVTIVQRKYKPGTQITEVTGIEEYFLYNEREFVGTGIYQGIPISKDEISYIHSGLLNENGTIIQSHLHKAMKALNQLRMMEDSTVIYRITRAAERRVFYVDTGSLPPKQAKQYLQEIASKYKNRLIYNVNTGEMSDERRLLSMQEDFWIPRREGSTGTQIDTLPGAQHMNELDDVDYFRKRLYRSLNVPVTRMDQNEGVTLGRATEITRDELKFRKFIDGLLSRLAEIFINALRLQLILKGVVDEDDWDDIAPDINFVWASDSYFSELKQSELDRDRIDVVDKYKDYEGKYISKKEIRKRLLKQTDEDIKRLDAEMAEEAIPKTPDLDAGEPGKSAEPDSESPAAPEVGAADTSGSTGGGEPAYTPGES